MFPIMKVFFTLYVLLFTTVLAYSQGTPADFLSPEFHKERRDLAREKMPANSVAVFFANAVRNRANDVDYSYHQDPDFYYLTGYNEPNSVLLIFSDSQTDEKGNEFNEAIYVQKRDPSAEQWDGKRLGVEGVAKLGFEYVFNGGEFQNIKLDFTAFDKVLVFDFKNDYRDTSKKADLYDLVSIFKEKANYPPDYSVEKQELYATLNTVEIEKSAAVAKNLADYIKDKEHLKNDYLLNGYVNAEDEHIRMELQEKMTLKINTDNFSSSKLNQIMSTLRETKTEEELILLKKAVEISAVGQVEVMKAMHPNMSETEIQGVHEYVYKKYGAEHEGYPSIVGGGNNGCILHYIENNKTKVGNDLVLMDLGAEYHGYTADVTRTIPANGKFSAEQKLIYDIVYNAQEAGIKASIVGAPFGAPGKAARKVVTDGLLKLGIILKPEDDRIYFPHGTSHYLGLDVHDKGTYGPFKANTVITVEPGIYIAEGSDCDKKWWGIAVRIEDDILITTDGPVNLSGMAPRTTEAIEALMKQPSPLDDFVLPKLD